MKFVSCSNIQSGLRFEYNCIKLCCFMGENTPEPLYVKKNWYGEKLNWNEIVAQIKDIREKTKQGIIDSHCRGCFALQEQDWEDNEKFKWMQIAHWSECNCNCTYCYRLQSDFEKPKKRYRLMPIIKELDKMGMIDYNGELAYSGGEPASLREFDDITNFFLKKGERLIMVHTNAIKPVKSVLNGLKTDTMSVTASVDCGDRQTFKRIKQVDAYDKVMNTLAKYVKAQGENKTMVRSKFIIMPGVNDTKENVDNWINESMKIGIKQLIIDFEAFWLDRNANRIPKHIDDLFDYMVDAIKRNGLEIQYYGVANKYRTIQGKDTEGFGLH